MKTPWMVLSRQRQRALRRKAGKCKDANQRTRYMIVVHSAQCKPVKQIAEALGCSTSTVVRTRRRWRDRGEAGLVDRREDNRSGVKADEHYLQTLRRVLIGTAPDHGHRRPTWTLKLLAETMRQATGVRLSPSRLSRVLRSIGARWGRPKPTVDCPWPRARKKRCLANIRTLIENLPADEAAVWEDEVDIDLNPRIGPDWMLPGFQRQVCTPGQNVKRDVAGAMDARSDRLIWVKGLKKNSLLFIDLLEKLLKHYPAKKTIHVILDNYVIHRSRQTRAWLSDRGRRIRLHFLPPYCPDDNRIERCAWRELHANVTRNHQCEDMKELMHEVTSYMIRHNRRRYRKAG